ncbi:MAG: acyl transferase [Cytophagales bacterium]
MSERDILKSEILNLNHSEPEKFDDLAIRLFRYQFGQNQLFRKWCIHFNKTPDNVTTIIDLPFIPISFFKQFELKSTEMPTKMIFKSSGTSGLQNSQHFITDLEIYEKVCVEIFEHYFGDLSNFYLLALLPNYLEQGNSSLVYMINHFMKKSRNDFDAFFLYDWERLNQKIIELSTQSKPVVLWGVTYALLDFSEKYNIKLTDNFLVFETGGMKGRKKEMIREEVHETLKNSFGVDKIYSEYGMTEMLSQAYITHESSFFIPASTLKLLIREHNDPFSISSSGRGLLNVIDLANIDSCAFFATDDIGVVYRNGSFDVLGRSDLSENRGCNLLWVG